MSDISHGTAARIRIAILCTCAAVSLAVFALLLRQWSASASAATSPSMIVPLLGFCVALCTGIAVGVWWPNMRTESVPDEAGNTPRETPTMPSEPEVRTDDTPTVSALMEEEHIIGARPDVSATEVDVAPNPEPMPDAIPETMPEPRPEPMPQAATPTPAVTIDDLPRDEALSAKDEVIRSLENIVKENRDRWADYEIDRELLESKIQNLEAELRIAHQIIENGGEDQDVFVPPQVFSRA